MIKRKRSFGIGRPRSPLDMVPFALLDDPSSTFSQSTSGNGRYARPCRTSQTQGRPAATKRTRLRHSSSMIA